MTRLKLPRFSSPVALTVATLVGCSSGSLESGDSANGAESGGTSSSDLAPGMNEPGSSGGAAGQDCDSLGTCATGGNGDGDRAATGGSSTGGAPVVVVPEQCTDGLLNGAATVCCASSCGTCGGTGCGDLPGGSEACCAGVIVESGVSCLDQGAPCIVEDDPTGTGGATGGDGDGDGDGDGPPPEDVLYDNPLDSTSDVGEVQASLTNDGTDGLLSLASGAPCASGSCLSIRHDYEGENNKSRKVNGEYAMGASSSEATFTYDVFFESGFDFRKQGKLPGVIPTSPHFGGNKNDPPHPEKWSARVMWFKSGDADGDGEVRPDLYLYDQDRNQGQTGEHNNQGGFGFTTNTWHTVTLYVKLNSAGATRDGRAELWVDDQLMACRTNKIFRESTGSNTEIQRIAFHNYFGGSQDYDWPHDEQFSYFDSLRIVDGRATPYVPSSDDCESHIRNQ